MDFESFRSESYRRSMGENDQVCAPNFEGLIGGTGGL